jgi:hypothetical protein
MTMHPRGRAVLRVVESGAQPAVEEGGRVVRMLFG